MIKKISKIKTDEDLCCLIGQNNKEAFDLIYNQYSSILYGVAIQAVGSEQYAAEVVQNTFLKLWQSTEDFQSQKLPFKIWLIRQVVLQSRIYLKENGKIQMPKITQLLAPAKPLSINPSPAE